MKAFTRERPARPARPEDKSVVPGPTDRRHASRAFAAPTMAECSEDCQYVRKKSSGWEPQDRRPRPAALWFARGGALTGLLALSVLLAGCAGLPGASPWLPGSAASAPPPAAVVARSALPFCGLEDQRDGAGPDRAIRECFAQAHAEGRGAEFASVNTTMEGAPIAEIHRTENGAIEVLTDFTQDPWGGGVWVRTRCGALRPDPGDLVFQLDACGEPESLAAEG